MISRVLTLCTALTCDDHVIAQDSDADIINHTLYVESEEMGDAWVAPNANDRIGRYLARFNITTPPALVVDYDYTVEGN